jgi:hypothetical protein
MSQDELYNWLTIAVSQFLVCEVFGEKYDICQEKMIMYAIATRR